MIHYLTSQNDQSNDHMDMLKLSCLKWHSYFLQLSKWGIFWLKFSIKETCFFTSVQNANGGMEFGCPFEWHVAFDFIFHQICLE